MTVREWDNIITCWNPVSLATNLEAGGARLKALLANAGLSDERGAICRQTAGEPALAEAGLQLTERVVVFLVLREKKHFCN